MVFPPHRQQTSAVTKMASQAALHYTANLLQSRCASRGVISTFETSCTAGAPLRMTTANGGQKILVAKSTFVRTFSLFQARKMVDIPQWKRELACFNGIFPHFLTSPPVSHLVNTAH